MFTIILQGISALLDFKNVQRGKIYNVYKAGVVCYFTSDC